MHVFSHQHKQRINVCFPQVHSWLHGHAGWSIQPCRWTSFSGRLWHILPLTKHPPRTIGLIVEHRGVHFFCQFLFPVLSKKWCFQHVGKVKRWKHLAIPWCYSIYIYPQSVAEIRRVQRCVCGWCVVQKWLHDHDKLDGLKLRKSCWVCLVINEMSTTSAG